MPDNINPVLDLPSRTKAFNVWVFKYRFEKYDAIFLEFDFVRRLTYLGRFIPCHPARA